ncbi:MAG: hypothetical protein JXQ90_07620 [Cyclobacteriaceae bacterium]
MRIKTITVALLMCTGLLVQAQHTISYSLLNHSWAFPLSKIVRVTGPVSPGFTIGTEFEHKQWKKNTFIQSIQLGGFINKSTGAGYFILTDLGLKHDFKRVQSEFSTGLGWMNSYTASEVWERGDEGFQRAENQSASGMLMSFSLGLRYPITAAVVNQVVPFVLYQWIASTPYFDVIPIRPQGLLHIGTIVHF